MKADQHSSSSTTLAFIQSGRHSRASLEGLAITEATRGFVAPATREELLRYC